jgi:uncharacterized protein (TIGR02246 family)
MADGDAAAKGSEARLADLERRLARLEDELAIHRLIVRYGFAVDTGDAEATAALFTEDGLYDVDGTLIMRGRSGVREMVLGRNHQSLLPNCAHTIGPAVVEVGAGGEPDRAVATAYSRIYLRKPDGIALWRLSFNRFELVRRDGRWQIARRTTRMVGHEEAHAVLARGLLAP